MLLPPPLTRRVVRVEQAGAFHVDLDVGALDGVDGGFAGRFLAEGRHPSPLNSTPGGATTRIVPDFEKNVVFEDAGAC